MPALHHRVSSHHLHEFLRCAQLALQAVDLEAGTIDHRILDTVHSMVKNTLINDVEHTHNGYPLSRMALFENETQKDAVLLPTPATLDGRVRTTGCRSFLACLF